MLPLLVSDLLAIDDGLAILHNSDGSPYQGDIKTLPLSRPAWQFRRGGKESVHPARMMTGWFLLGVGFNLDRAISNPCTALQIDTTIGSGRTIELQMELEIIKFGNRQEYLATPSRGSRASPPSTFQVRAPLGSLNFQPVKSLPLNKVIGLPHFGVRSCPLRVETEIKTISKESEQERAFEYGIANSAPDIWTEPYPTHNLLLDLVKSDPCNDGRLKVRHFQRPRIYGLTLFHHLLTLGIEVIHLAVPVRAPERSIVTATL